MRKKLSSIIGAVVVTAALTTPSSAQTIDANTVQAASVTGAVTFAKEIFSPGSDPAINLRGVEVTIGYGQLATTNIAAGRDATITYTLSGGTFADAPAKPVYREGGTEQAAKVTISDGTGATVGSSSVSYRVTVGSSALNQASSAFVFTLPRVQGVASVLSAPAVNMVEPTIAVMITVSPTYPSLANSFPMFPQAATPDDQRSLTVASSANYVTIASMYPQANATTTAAVIDTNNPTRLVPTTSDGTVQSAQVRGVPNGGTIGLVVSRIQVGRNTGALTEDGATTIIPVSGDRFIVQAMGNFAPGDVLFYSTDANYGATEGLTITGQTARLEMELISGLSNLPTTLYYVPAAGSVREGTFSSSYIVDLRQKNNAYAGPTIAPGNVMTSFSGITTRGYAYALPNPESGDIGNLRIRCQGSAACEVFLQCMDMAGARVGDGGLKRVTIAAGAVEHLSTRSSLPELLGVSMWTGRLSCNIMSNREIGVQLLVRSGDTLTNNTYIGGQMLNRWGLRQPASP